MRPAIAFVAVLTAALPAVGEPTPSALSEERVAGLLAGAGLGYARAAELNGWPGPLHVLELGAALELTREQAERMAALRQEMLEAARPLGRKLIEAERRLDRLFIRGEPTPAAVAAATAETAAIEGRLRAVHLTTHVKAHAVLSPKQNRRYAELRRHRH